LEGRLETGLLWLLVLGLLLLLQLGCVGRAGGLGTMVWLPFGLLSWAWDERHKRPRLHLLLLLHQLRLLG